MATISNTISEKIDFEDQRAAAITYSWSSLGTGDDGDPVNLVDYADRTVQVSGTFGGATVAIEGSLDGTNWNNLTDAVGNELSFSSADLAAVLECTPYIRPLVTGGSSPSINIFLTVRRG